MNNTQPNTGIDEGAGPTTLEEASSAGGADGFPTDGQGGTGVDGGAPQGGQSGSEVERLRAENEQYRRQIGEMRAQGGQQQGTPPTPPQNDEQSPPQQGETPAPALTHTQPQSRTEEGFPETAPQQQQGQRIEQQQQGQQIETPDQEIVRLRKSDQVNRFFIDNVNDPNLTDEVKQEVRDMVMSRDMSPEDAAKIVLYDKGHAAGTSAAGRPNPGASFNERVQGENPDPVDDYKNASAQQKRAGGNQAVRSLLVGNDAPGRIAFGN